MRKLIQKCYDHHSAGFLLEFSRKLMIATQDSNKIKVIDNGDGTRSMRSALSDKLLVTFRSENQDYDKKQRQQFNSFTTQSPLKKRCSLSLGINASDPRLPRCEDLYLCDNCGSSFKSLVDVLVSCPKFFTLLIISRAFLRYYTGSFVMLCQSLEYQQKLSTRLKI